EENNRCSPTSQSLADAAAHVSGADDRDTSGVDVHVSPHQDGHRELWPAASPAYASDSWVAELALRLHPCSIAITFPDVNWSTNFGEIWLNCWHQLGSSAHSKP